MGKSRSFSLVVLLCFLITCLIPASTEGLSYIPCNCGQEPCICFIQLMDEGPVVNALIQRLQAQGYAVDADLSQFTQEILDATLRFQADHGLPLTGTWDDTSLTLLIWGMTPEELDEAMPPIAGSEKTYPDLCYVPTDGGHKRHSKSGCCQMYDPRKMSIRNAAALGYDPCGICEKSREASLARKYQKAAENEEDPALSRAVVRSYIAGAGMDSQQAETTYIVNKNTKKFHLPDCSSVQRMKEKNRLEVTCTREELLDQGYQPCDNCKP